MCIRVGGITFGYYYYYYCCYTVSDHLCCGFSRCESTNSLNREANDFIFLYEANGFIN